MIYFDNAATTKNKPDCVYEAFNYYIREIGVSPGRGSYPLAIESSRMLFNCRKAVAKFFGMENSSNVVFSKNSTEAINLYLNGFLKKGDHVLITPYEHNAVLRPLHSLKQREQIDYSIFPENVLYADKPDLSALVNERTKMCIMTLASNLTGQIVFNPQIAKWCNEKGIVVFVDASQGGGKKLVNIVRDSIDVLAFTGHKDLLALPGVGGLCSQDELKIQPLIQGGTGIYGDSYTNPNVFPEIYEAGTLNMPAIWSLKASLGFIEKNLSEISLKEKLLVELLISELKMLPFVELYNANKTRVSTIAFNHTSITSSDVVAKLGKSGICVRGGLHCSILAHEAINTVEKGAVRLSINYFNSEEEILTFIDVLKGIC